MEAFGLASALQLVAYLSGIGILAAALGGLVAGVFRVVTQIDDPAIAFAGRFAGIALLLYFAAGLYSSEVLEFTSRFWTGADTFR